MQLNENFSSYTMRGRYQDTISLYVLKEHTTTSQEIGMFFGTHTFLGSWGVSSMLWNPHKMRINIEIISNITKSVNMPMLYIICANNI